MKRQLLKEELANMARLNAIVNLAEEGSTKLKQRGERFRRALNNRQDKKLRAILAHPKSKAYHDYIEVP